VYGFGNLNAKVVFVAEAPGEKEATYGKPFMGEAGRLLDRTLEEIGLTRADVYATNACLCRPDGNATPKANDIDMCNERLVAELDALKDKHVIVILGSSAVRGVTHTNESIMKAQGRIEWSDRFKCFLAYTRHPAAVLHNESVFPDYWDGMGNIKRVLALPLSASALAAPEIKFIVDDTVKGALSGIDWMSRHLTSDDIIAVDIETDYLDRSPKNPILDIGFCWRPGYTYIITRPALDDVRVRAKLNELLSKPLQWGGHNFKFDSSMLRVHKIQGAHAAWDTMLMAYLLDSRGSAGDDAWTSAGIGVGLKPLARKWCHAPEWEKDNKQYLRSTSDPFSNIPDHVRHPYLANDCYWTRELYFKLKAEMDSQPESEEGYPSLMWCHDNLLIPASNAFADIEGWGTPIDRQYTELMKSTYEAKMATIIQDIRQMVALDFFDPDCPGCQKIGDPARFNVNSSHQKAHLLYDHLRFPLYKEDPRDPGKRCCDKKVLENNKKRYAICQRLLDYSDLNRFYAIYFKGLLAKLDENDRLHVDYRLTGTDTGRASSTPNLQNIATAPAVKNMLVASPGMDFASFDFKSLESKVTAYLTRDANLNKAVEGDIHTATMNEIFKPIIDECNRLKGDERALLEYIKTQPLLRSSVKRYYAPPMMKPTLFGDVMYELRFRTKFVCTAVSSYTVTELGLVRGDELLPHEGSYTVDANMTVATIDGPQAATQLVRIEQQPVYRIVLNGNLELLCTPEHPIMTDHGWVSACELQRNDWVQIALGTNVWGNRIDLPEVDVYALYTRHFPNRSIQGARPRAVPTLPTEMTLPLARLVGYYISEGCINWHDSRPQGITFAATDLEIREELLYCIQDVFGIDNRQLKHSKHTIQLDYALVAHWWLAVFPEFHNSGAGQKVIPLRLRCAPREFLLAMLGAAWNGDGHVNRHSSDAAYGTNSPELARQVQYILINAGVFSTITSQRNPALRRQTTLQYESPYHYQTHCLSYELSALRHELGLISSKALPEEARTIQWRSRTRMVVDAATYVQVNSADLMEETEDVFDLTVPNGHSWVTNGLVSHNTFGISYGRSAQSLATSEEDGLGVPVPEAQAYLNRFWGHYADWKVWIEQQVHYVKTRGYLATPMGRRRQFPFLTNNNISMARRQAMNTPPQSFASDITLRALVKIHEIFMRENLGRVLFFVHDSIEAEIWRTYAPRALQVMRECMEEYAPPQSDLVKFVAEGDVGKRWGTVLSEAIYLAHHRDNFTCADCGQYDDDFPSNLLLAEYIDDNDENDEISNLITLCTTCRLKRRLPRVHARNRYKCSACKQAFAEEQLTVRFQNNNTRDADWYNLQSICPECLQKGS